MGAEVRTTSDNSATREACAGNRSGARRYLSIKELRIQEARHKNEFQLKSEDTILNRADTETGAHASESLTMLLRQIPQRRGEGQTKALACLILTKCERKTPYKPRRGGKDCDECNGKEDCNALP